MTVWFATLLLKLFPFVSGHIKELKVLGNRIWILFKESSISFDACQQLAELIRRLFVISRPKSSALFYILYKVTENL